MEYKVLYRKYRPDNFENVVGQNFTINILKNAIINNKIAHAYIFNGPRGTGKTSTAKVFAKAINCQNSTDGNPCGKCESCMNISNNPDIIEIDAASNNGVDEIRELINNIKIAPSYSKYKVYIIDEVHMMTQSAFNALLLTLEEPPEHIVFILATTNIESVPITILSRCQKFDFKKIDNKVIEDRINNICDKENIQITEEAVKEIAYLSEGGMRDALSILDQLSSNSNKIDLELIINNFGSVPNILIDNILDALIANSFDFLKESLEKVKDSNVDYKVFIKKLIDQLAIKSLDSSSDLDIEIAKNIIFDLIKILNNYNININPFMLIELSLLKYVNISQKNDIIEKKVDSKIISREIILNSKSISQEIKKDENVGNINDFDEKKDLNKQTINSNRINNVISDEIKNIRINNCFVNAQKKYLLDAKDEIQNVKDDNFDNAFLMSMLADSNVVAASDKVYIMTSLLDSVVNLININVNSIEEKLHNIKIIALTEDEWNSVKSEYIKKLKNGYKYELIDEPINKVENETTIENKAYNETIEDVAEQLFSSSKIEIE